MQIKHIFAAFALCMAFGAHAGGTVIDTSGLSESQIAELKASAAAKVAETAKAADGSVIPTNPTAAVTLAATWGTQAAEAAKGFASALSIAAKELGVTINDFLHTDAGRLTAALIIWKVAGSSIIHLLFGMAFAMVGMVMTRVIYVKLFTKGYEKVEYSRFGGFFKGTKMIRIPKGFHDLDNDGEWLAFWLMLIVCLGSLVIAGVIIT